MHFGIFLKNEEALPSWNFKCFWMFDWIPCETKWCVLALHSGVFFAFLKLLEKHKVLARSGFLYILPNAETPVWVSKF